MRDERARDAIGEALYALAYWYMIHQTPNVPAQRRKLLVASAEEDLMRAARRLMEGKASSRKKDSRRT